MERYNTERYNFPTQEGLDVYIQIDLDKGCKIWFTENNNIEYELKGFFSNFKTQTLIIEWIETIKDLTGEIISSKVKSSLKVNDEFFTDFNTYASSTHFHIKQCMNIIMGEEIQYVCFDRNGAFSPTHII